MIGVIVNANALGVRRDPALADRLRAVLEPGEPLIVTRDGSELDAAVERLCGLGCDPLALCGGDGTHLATLTRLVARSGGRRLPRLAMLRGGTVNTVAGNLGIHGRPEHILARLGARLRQGAPLDTVEQDLLEANGMYGFLFAAAMGARFLESYYALPAQGVAAASWLAARTALSSLVMGQEARWLFEPVAVSLVADGEPLPLSRARLLVASTVPDVGLGMRVAWRAGRADGRFHLVASAISTPSMALQLPRVLTGRPLRGTPHEDRLLRTLELRFERPQAFTIDGDLFRAEHVALRIGPRVRVCR